MILWVNNLKSFSGSVPSWSVCSLWCIVFCIPRLCVAWLGMCAVYVIIVVITLPGREQLVWNPRRYLQLCGLPMPFLGHWRRSNWRWNRPWWSSPPFHLHQHTHGSFWEFVLRFLRSVEPNVPGARQLRGEAALGKLLFLLWLVDYVIKTAEPFQKFTGNLPLIFSLKVFIVC